MQQLNFWVRSTFGGFLFAALIGVSAFVAIFW